MEVALSMSLSNLFAKVERLDDGSFFFWDLRECLEAREALEDDDILFFCWEFWDLSFAC